MRFIVGIGLLFGIFWCAEKLSGSGLMGYLNAEAFVIVVLSPWAVALMVFEWRDISVHFSTLLRALSFSEKRAQQDIAQAYFEIASAVQEDRTFDAVQLIEGNRDEAVRTGGLLFLKRYERDRLREAFVAKSQQGLARMKRGEDFFMTLARAAPAFGLIGTIKGFINLLSHIKDSETLGVGMAMALTATLYGVALSYCIFHPAAKCIGAFVQKRRQHFREAEQAILMIYDGRHTGDLDMFFPARASVNGGSVRGAEGMA